MTKLPLMTLAATLALAACASTPGEPQGAASTPAGDSQMAADQAPASAAPATPAGNPTVGGAPMLATQTIVQNASAAPNLTTLVAAVKAAGLVDTLSGHGPFTVFAPTNDAFGRLAPGTVDSLLKPENKASLVKVLTYHVVPGAISSAELARRITAGGGTATLTTVEGQPITATKANGVVTLTDVGGNKSYIETADVKQSNGVVHVVNGVLVPTLG